MNIKLHTPILFFFLFIGTSTFAADMMNELNLAISGNNSKGLSKYFNTNVELKIINQEDIYSKAQAELIVKDFFLKHPVESFYFVHKSEPKNESMYAIGSMQTTKAKYRLYFLFKKVGAQYLIQQLSIELENE